MRVRQPKIVDVDPQVWLTKFDAWAQSVAVPVSALFEAVQRKTWPMEISSQEHGLNGAESVKLSGAELGLLKRIIARRVYELGGQYPTGIQILRSDDGVTFTVH